MPSLDEFLQLLSSITPQKRPPQTRSIVPPPAPPPVSPQGALNSLPEQFTAQSVDPLVQILSLFSPVGTAQAAKPPRNSMLPESGGDTAVDALSMGGGFGPRSSPASRPELILQEFDARKAPDIDYRSAFSTGSKSSLRRGQTWRSRLLEWVNRERQRDGLPPLP